MKMIRTILVCAVFALSSPCFAQNSPHRHDAGEKLGTVSFPISCAPATQAQFERGVALLYSFEYETAANQFQEIAKKDSTCAMVYWGQAMSLYHQLWDRPPKADLKRGAEFLARASALHPPTARERDWYIADDLKGEHNIVQAWAKYAADEKTEAVGLLRSVADMQDKVGKRETEMPAREMLADMLLEMNHPQEALAEYETSLRTDPNRFNGLYGAAQAAELTQQKEKAAGYYAQLLKNCDGINSDRPELAQAKTLLAAN